MTTDRVGFLRARADTGRRILEAATAEFSAVGLAGARIAERPRQPAMIYAYDGSKDLHFNAVLEHHIQITPDAVDFDATGLPSYARAERANSWTDAPRRDPGISVVLLTAPDRPKRGKP